MTQTGYVLLADDNATDAELTIRALEIGGVGQQIVWVQDGEAALQYVFRTGVYAQRAPGNPRLMLLDLHMPKVDGLEVLAQAWNYGRNDDPDKPEYDYLREADYCSGAAIAVPAALFRELRGFDPRYAPAYYEDTDLAFAVRAAKRKVFYQPQARVVHIEGQTQGTDESGGIKRHQIVNQATFAKKWAKALATHRPNGVQPELERDRWAARRVLVIDACMLTPDQDSGSVRMQTLLEVLTGLHCKVTFQEQIMVSDLDVLENLDLLEEIDDIEKVVQVVDQRDIIL